MIPYILNNYNMFLKKFFPYSLTKTGKCDSIVSKAGDAISLCWCYLTDSRARGVSSRAFFFFKTLLKHKFTAR